MANCPRVDPGANAAFWQRCAVCNGTRNRKTMRYPSVILRCLDVPHWEPAPSVLRAGTGISVPYRLPPLAGQVRGVRAPSGYQRAISPGVTHFGKWMRAYRSAAIWGVYDIGRSPRAMLPPTTRIDSHIAGFALDLNISGVGPNLAVGSPIADWLVVNALQMGIQLVIWSRTAWATGPRGGNFSEYRGASTHDDHIHMEFNADGAAKRTAWFRSNPEPSMTLSAMRGTRNPSAAGILKPVDWTLPDQIGPLDPDVKIPNYDTTEDSDYFVNKVMSEMDDWVVDAVAVGCIAASVLGTIILGGKDQS